MNVTEHDPFPTPDYRLLIRDALHDLRQARVADDHIGGLRAEREMNRLLELLTTPAAAA